MASLFEQDFQEAADTVQKLKTKPTDSELLRLYGLYKQARVGDNTTASPSFLDLKGQSKWRAWASHKGMAKEEAMRQYVAAVRSLIDKYGLDN